MNDCIAPAGKRTDWICLGDIWKDCDPRGPGREVTVTSTDGPKVTVVGFIKTRINPDRMRPTASGYELLRKTCPTHKGQTA